MTFITLENIQERELVPGFRGRFVHTDNMTLAYWRIDAGAAMPEHAHPHEQMTNLIQGEFEMTVEGESKLIGPGNVVTIPSNALHAGRAVTDCVIIDVFWPTREEYR